MARLFPTLVAVLISLQVGSVHSRDLEATRGWGIMRVGVSTFVPWVAKSSDGEFTGSEVDIANRLSSDANANIESIELPFAELIGALGRERIDAVAGMPITPEHALQVDSTRPLAYSNDTLAGRQDRLSGRSTLADDEAKVRRRAGNRFAALVMNSANALHLGMKYCEAMAEASAAPVCGTIRVAEERPWLKRVVRTSPT